MNRFYFILLLSFFALASSASLKKDLAQVKASLKTGKELDKAERIMNDVLAQPDNRKEVKTWLLLFDVIKKKYDQGNERLYLQQSADTVTMYDLTKKMCLTLKSIDSVEVVNANGDASRLKYRKKHAEALFTYKPNLFFGGTYFMSKKMYDKAYDFFSLYIDCAQMPIFTGYDILNSDTKLPRAAFFSVFCGYKLHAPELALRYLPLAEKDKERHEYLLQYLADVYLSQNNTDKYMAILKEGFQDYPTQTYFYTRLIEHYSKNNNWASANEYIDQALTAMPEHLWLRVAKTTILLNLGRYDACIALCDSIIASHKDLPEVYLNAGLAYFNRAVEAEKTAKTSRDLKKKVAASYRSALPYMEQYRRLEPKDESRWLLPLYTIYLNLNMGKEFEEMDKLMKAAE
jgi:hypothetical protein